MCLFCVYSVNNSQIQPYKLRHLSCKVALSDAFSFMHLYQFKYKKIMGQKNQYKIIISHFCL